MKANLLIAACLGMLAGCCSMGDCGGDDCSSYYCTTNVCNSCVSNPCQMPCSTYKGERSYYYQAPVPRQYVTTSCTPCQSCSYNYINKYCVNRHSGCWPLYRDCLDRTVFCNVGGSNFEPLSCR